MVVLLLFVVVALNFLLALLCTARAMIEVMMSLIKSLCVSLHTCKRQIQSDNLCRQEGEALVLQCDAAIRCLYNDGRGVMHMLCACCAQTLFPLGSKDVL